MKQFENISAVKGCLNNEQLQGYIQQSLNKEDVYQIELHLADCPFCSDAIDGFMEQPTAKIPFEINSIKTTLIQKINETYFIESLEKEEEKPILKATHTPRKFIHKWMAAASILLLFGLGSYSVFSFIQSQQRKLALQDKEKHALNTSNEYSELKNSHQNEHVQLSIPEGNEVKKVLKNVKEKSPEKIVATKKSIPVLANKNQTKIVPAIAKETKTAEAPAESILESQAYHDNYSNSESKKAASPVPEDEKKDVERNNADIVRKSSSYGMSRNKEIPQVVSPASNQLNYPAQNNNDNNAIFNNRESVSAKNKTSNSYLVGMQLYQQKNYEKAIQEFENALKNNPSNSEDIQYYLGMSYYNNGNTHKAKKIFKKLSDSEKYGSQIPKEILTK